MKHMMLKKNEMYAVHQGRARVAGRRFEARVGMWEERGAQYPVSTIRETFIAVVVIGC